VLRLQSGDSSFVTSVSGADAFARNDGATVANKLVNLSVDGEDLFVKIINDINEFPNNLPYPELFGFFPNDPNRIGTSSPCVKPIFSTPGRRPSCFSR
jgi:hypothetical protein